MEFIFRMLFGTTAFWHQMVELELLEYNDGIWDTKKNVLINCLYAALKYLIRTFFLHVSKKVYTFAKIVLRT